MFIGNGLLSVPSSTVSGSSCVLAVESQLSLSHTPLHSKSQHPDSTTLPSPPYLILLGWPYNLVSKPEQFGEKKRALCINNYARTTGINQDPTYHPPIKGENFFKKKQLTELTFVVLSWSASDKGASIYKCILCHRKRKYSWEVACYRMHRKARELGKFVNALET